MEPYLIILSVGVLLGSATVLFRRTRRGQVEVPPRVTNGTLAIFLLLGLAYLSFVAFAPPRKTATSESLVIPIGDERPALGSYPIGPLVAGDELPPLEAAGWLNGPPPVPGKPGPRLILVDLWAHWCPLCSETAPGLVEVYRKYKDRGVAFVSLTNMEEGSVKWFVDEFSIPWPCGHGSALRTIANLGAYSPDRTVPGYEVSPTLYLVGKDGRIRWCDRKARLRHVASEPQMKDLESALEHELAKVAPESKSVEPPRR